MITNDGKEIISRYLLNQVPSYATHIAIGCGATPLDANDIGPTVAEMANKKRLDFEMARIPITSKGFINQKYSYTISSASVVSNFAILKTTEFHNIDIGDTVVISGINTTYDGIQTVYDIPSATTFTFPVIASDASASVSGIATVSKTKVSLTAEIPAENKYEITEVGLWSAPNNSLAINSDSYLICNFTESWQAHDSNIYSPPDRTNLGNSTIDIVDGDNRVFYAFTSDPLFQSNDRKTRKEGPRFLNKTLMIRGDASKINNSVVSITSASANGSSIRYGLASASANIFVVGDKVTIVGCSNSIFNVFNETITSSNGNNFTISSTITGNSTGGNAWVTGSWKEQVFDDSRVSTHVHLNGISLNISKNNPSDIMTLAFSLMDKDGTGANGDPDYIKIMVEFYKSEITTTTGFAKAEIYIPGSEFTANRYRAYSFPLSNLITTTDFTSSEIRVARIFSTIVKSSVPSSNFYLCFDGLRLDNISTINPIYKLSGYSVVRTSNGYPIIKYQNTNNYIDFRFNLGISG